MLLGTTLELSVFLGEVPTGIVADVYSRKYSIIIGVFLTGLGFLLEGLFPWVVTIFIAQAVWGIGATFMSGARDAWLAGELGEENLADTLLMGWQIGRVVSLLGMGIALLLALYSSVQVPIIVGGAGMMISALFLPFIMPETGFEPVAAADQSTYQQMVQTFQQGWATVRHSRILLLMILATLFAGLASEGIDRFWEVHLLENFTFPQLMADVALPSFGADFADFGGDITLWFFLINFVAQLIGLLVTAIVRKKVQVDQNESALKWLILANGVVMVGVLTFGLTISFEAAIAAWFVILSFRWTVGPISSALLNRHIPQEVRATVLSMKGQADAIGQTVSGPLMGTIVTVGSLRIAFVAVVILLAPILLIYWLVLSTISKLSDPD